MSVCIISDISFERHSHILATQKIIDTTTTSRGDDELSSTLADRAPTKVRHSARLFYYEDTSTKLSLVSAWIDVANIEVISNAVMKDREDIMDISTSSFRH